jgi:hypothetical protein
MMRIFFGYRPCFYECGGRGYQTPSEHSYTKYGYENPQSIQTHQKTSHPSELIHHLDQQLN